MDKPGKKTVVAWRNFLSTPDGELGLLYLMAQAPTPFPDDDGKMIFAAGQVAGYDRAFKNLDAFLEDLSKVEEDTIDRLRE